MARVAEILKEYYEVKELVAELEKKRKELKKKLVNEFGKDCEVVIDGMKLKISEREKTIFSSKKIYEHIASEELLEAISEKIKMVVVDVKPVKTK